MSKFIRYSLLAVIIVIGVGILSGVFDLMKTRNFQYGILHEQENKYLNLFVDSISANMKFKAAFGNEKEEIYVYEHLNEYNLIVWSIEGFKNVSPKDLAMYGTDQFAQIGFNPKNYTEWGIPKVTLSSKAEYLTADTLTMFVEMEYDYISHTKKDNFLFINLSSSGFALSDSLIDDKLKIEFESKLHFNVCFLNDGTRFNIVLLKPHRDYSIKGDLLFGLLKATRES